MAPAVLLAVLAATWLTLVRAQTNYPYTADSSWNYTFSAIDGQLAYDPTYDSAANDSPHPPLWNTTYSSSPWSEYKTGAMGVGQPMRWYNGTSGTLSFNFMGTVLFIEGTASPLGWNKSLPLATVQVDAQSFTVNSLYDDTTIFSTAVPWGYHSVTLRILQACQVFITNVTVTTGAEVDGHPFSEAKLLEHPAIVDGKIADGNLSNTSDTSDSNCFTWTGSWRMSPDIGIPTNNTAPPVNQTIGVNGTNMTTTPVPVMASTANISTAVGFSGSTVLVAIPANTSFVVFNATTGPNCGAVDINWGSQGPPLSGNSQRVFTNDAWEALTPIFMTPLDPTIMYNATLSLADGQPDGRQFSFHGVTFYQWKLPTVPEQEAEVHADHKVAIACGVVFGVLGVVLIGLAIWWLRRRKRRQKDDAPSKGGAFWRRGGGRRTPTPEQSKYEIDLADTGPTPSLAGEPEDHATVTPFVPDAPRPVEAATPHTPRSPRSLPPLQISHQPVDFSSPLSTGIPLTAGSFYTPGPTPLAPTPTPPAPPVRDEYVAAKAQTLELLDEHERASAANTLAGNANLGVAQGLAAAGSPTTPKSAGVPPQAPRRPIQREEDAGTVVLEPEVLPPLYNPEWARHRPETEPNTPVTPTATLNTLTAASIALPASANPSMEHLTVGGEGTSSGSGLSVRMSQSPTSPIRGPLQGNTPRSPRGPPSPAAIAGRLSAHSSRSLTAAPTTPSRLASDLPLTQSDLEDDDEGENEEESETGDHGEEVAEVHDEEHGHGIEPGNQHQQNS